MDIISQIVDTLIVLLQNDVEYETTRADSIYIFVAENSKIIIKLDVYKKSIIGSGLEQLCE